MPSFSLKVRRIERASVATPPGRALATAVADFGLWRVGARDEFPTPIERKLRHLRFFRIGTTTDSVPFDDGTYPENGFAFGSGWTHPHENSEGMPADAIMRLIRVTDSYVTYLGDSPNAFLSIQHPDGPGWFRDAVMAGERYTLRLDLTLVRESEHWFQQESREARAKAFTNRHPLFFNVTGADLVQK